MPTSGSSTVFAEDIVNRLGHAEKKISIAQNDINVHEEKCAGRYKTIIVLLIVIAATNTPVLLGKLVTLLEILK